MAVAEAVRAPVPGGPYRVEYRSGEATTQLGRIERCFAHHAELVPYAVHLRLRGQTGDTVVLVQESTGSVVARRDIARMRRRGRGPSD